MSRVILKIKSRGRVFFFFSWGKKKNRMPANKCRWNDRIGKVTICHPQWFGHKSLTEANTHLVKEGDREKETVCTVSEYCPTDYLIIIKGEIYLMTKKFSSKKPTIQLNTGRGLEIDKRKIAGNPPNLKTKQHTCK